MKAVGQREAEGVWLPWLWMLMGTLIWSVCCRPLPAFSKDATIISYAVHFQGSLEKLDLAAFRPFLDSVRLQPEGAVSLAQLRRRAQRDQQTLRRWLRSQGYYGCRVTFRVETEPGPVQLVFQVAPGTPYLFDAPRLDAPHLEDRVRKELLDALNATLPQGAPAVSKDILEADQRLLTALANNGYPLSRIAKRKVVVDHQVHRVRVFYTVDPGPKAFFGPLRIQGLESVSEEVIRTRIPWREGRLFDRRLVHEARNRLISLDLFSLVRFSLGHEVDAQGRLPVLLTVLERKHRTFRGGLSYATDTGPGAKIFWQHRNLRHRGDRLDVGATASPIKQKLHGTFLVRDYMRRNQSLQMDAGFLREDTDAYLSRAAHTLLSLRRDLGRGRRAAAGIGFRLASVDEDEDKSSFALLHAPVLFTLDTTDDLLDPASGQRLEIAMTPYWDLGDLSLAFSKLSARAGIYRDLLDDRRLILAFQASVGTILGAGRDAVPADIRFYTGGGGSIRGYDYQSVGPLKGTDPVGGRSFFVVNAEARWKITQRYGMVLFVDGGSAYADSLPDPSDTLRWGAGLGVRYYSPLGPFRIDVAFPLNPREDIDGAFQFYVSLGQAF
ncbi:autotransporter secretion outer membrane protein TamA [Desulfacinum hydrothermale DSM 13146]|uniref:Autotransporter secretion outer membrane protein TamA n=1 Tax=Desulfacinum hydrothermale DSM 13146 TaxID=1121390 RepID=A0A1W1XLN5_9BACT|nr:BamA/TamA family outer membrane protein [Desulfacinum hydrothermale]SMC24461.1 autotransporter secretion outer membrane protein TamA [Desulfacinum hydrothermale DSM 13146]